MSKNRNSAESRPAWRRKQYWQSLEERENSAFADQNQPEFPRSPNEMTAESRELATKGTSRKNFLKFMGAGAVLATASCRRPTERIVPAVIQPPEIVPGVATHYSSVSPDGTGVILRTRAGRPVKIQGNPDHPLSNGGVSAFNVAGLMDLYDPDRLRRPVEIKEGKKLRTDIRRVLPLVANALKTRGPYVLLTGAVDSPSTRALINEFLKSVPGGKHVELRPDPTLRQIADAQQACYGQRIVPFYRFDRADMVVSIDGDFLGTMVQPTFFGASYGQKRDVRHQKQSMNRLVVFESMFSVTGSSADERYSIRPGDQTLIALSLAAHLVFSGRGGATGNAARGLLEQYRAEKVAAAINRGLYQKGYFEKIIAGVADALYENRGRSLVVGASPLAATAINGEGQIAINLLNSILENDGVTVDHGAVLNYSTGASYGEIQSLLSELESDRYKTLIIAGANPVYHLPNTEKVTKALTHVDTILALNDRVDETAQLAKYVLPTSHWLEAWGDAEPINGIRSVQQPVVRPLYNTLSFEDYLIQLAGGQLAGVGTFHEYLKQRWSAYSGGTTFRNFWTGVLQQGYHAPGRAALNGRRNGRNFRAASLQRLPGFDAGAQKADGNKFVLGMYYGVQVLDGTGANNAYRQELPDPVTKIVWDNYVAILPERARALGLEQGSIVEIKARGQSLKLPVHLQPGLHPDAALVALGYGREQAGKIANGVGANVIGLSAVGSDTLQLSGVVVELNDTGDARTLASTQTIYRKGDNQQESHLGIHNVPYRGSSQHDRPLVRETSWKALQNGQLALIPAAVEYPQNKEIMPEWDYRDTRWHMVIDLNQCTGCGACVTSCNIENNIPMVGRDQVAVGREMHWLRIDRYFSGEEAEAEVVHQPMLCQHCENAPCENVCPVAATTHSSEGLNLMTYNRCVGTRYCANNCPYKVRRFNWYENFIWAEGLERNLRDPLQLGLNPDVTVRARGIMEKCTFCIQRISTARQESRARGERYIPDGRVKTACQEVCPTSAISFGNVLDPDSEVQRLRENGRAYQVLDFLGVKPSITYLAKVRNRDVEQG